MRLTELANLPEREMMHFYFIELFRILDSIQFTACKPSHSGSVGKCPVNAELLPLVAEHKNGGPTTQRSPEACWSIDVFRYKVTRINPNTILWLPNQSITSNRIHPINVVFSKVSPSLFLCWMSHFKSRTCHSTVIKRWVYSVTCMLQTRWYFNLEEKRLWLCCSTSKWRILTVDFMRSVGW